MCSEAILCDPADADISMLGVWWMLFLLFLIFTITYINSDNMFPYMEILQRASVGENLNFCKPTKSVY